MPKTRKKSHLRGWSEKSLIFSANTSVVPSSLQAALDNKNSIRALAPAAVSAWILYHFETALMLGGMRVTLKMGVKKGRAGCVFIQSCCWFSS